VRANTQTQARTVFLLLHVAVIILILLLLLLLLALALAARLHAQLHLLGAAGVHRHARSSLLQQLPSKRHQRRLQ
jgi:hypothetical protein